MTLINDNCLHYLQTVKDNTYDLIVTDPPYGIAFMGKDWDKALPDKQVWKECYRTLKDGKFAFIMCSPRQDVLSRMIISLEDAGFRTNYTSIYWTYASGFPKAANVSKLIDKKAKAKREIIGINPNTRKNQFKGYEDYVNEDWNNHITKPATPEAKKMEGAYVGFQPKPAVEVILVVSKGKSLTWLDDCRIPYASDSDLKGATFGTQTDIKNNNYGTNRPSDGFVYARNVEGNQKGRFPANLLVSDDVLNEGSYSRYFSLDSWAKTFPFLNSKDINSECNNKNQWEDQTADQNHISQKENMNVINAENNLSTTKATGKSNITSAQRNAAQYSDSENLNPNALSAEKKQGYIETDTVLNIAATKQDTGILLEMLERELTTLIMQKEHIHTNQKDVNYAINKLKDLLDIIQISRNRLKLYGYVDPAIIERMRQDLVQDPHLQNLPPEVRKTFPFIVTPKASKSERNKGCSEIEPQIKGNQCQNMTNMLTGSGNIRATKFNNNHPTVKPLKLMSYLVTLGSREGDLVLDPFCGSGTTCIAAETLHRQYVGIEVNEEYYKIAQARLVPYLSQTKLL